MRWRSCSGRSLPGFGRSGPPAWRSRERDRVADGDVVLGDRHLLHEERDDTQPFHDVEGFCGRPAPRGLDHPLRGNSDMTAVSGGPAALPPCNSSMKPAGAATFSATERVGGTVLGKPVAHGFPNLVPSGRCSGLAVTLDPPVALPASAPGQGACDGRLHGKRQWPINIT